jgi:hypothetical protein
LERFLLSIPPQEVKRANSLSSPRHSLKKATRVLLWLTGGAVAGLLYGQYSNLSHGMVAWSRELAMSEVVPSIEKRSTLNNNVKEDIKGVLWLVEYNATFLRKAGQSLRERHRMGYNRRMRYSTQQRRRDDFIRPLIKYRHKTMDWPIPKTCNELDKLISLTSHIRPILPGRAGHVLTLHSEGMYREFGRTQLSTVKPKPKPKPKPKLKL